ncbi:C-type lectin domain-containing protein [Faecalicatena contorta]|uniref:C-type lectin domain-containing protein n=1 Tax=Faecalicatena contorta TaxID=39482 RepID=UPI00129EDD13|nr:C-type lectin domain-containing protein [Faecalicatena contorta]MRM87789.1 C-type lectin domain-containing protein [Faecalicatena contorta]
MKKPRHNGKILAIVIIGVIVVFAAGIGLGIVTGKKVQDSQKVTSNDAAGKAEQDKNSAAQKGDAANTDKDNGTKDPANNNTGDNAGDHAGEGTDSSKDNSQDENAADQNAGTYDASAPADDAAIHRYEYIKSDCTWTEAFQDCLNRGGYLARINSSEEYEYIRKEISRAGMTNIFFRIGGRRDDNSKDYYWVNENNKLFGEKLNSEDSWCSDEWKNGEPSFQDGSLEEQYMDLFFYDGEKRFVWNDVPDDMLAAESSYTGFLGYICEYE